MNYLYVNDYVVDFMSGNLEVGIYTTKNYDNENVIVQVIRGIEEEHLQVITCQNNGWLRINCYYLDGTTTETFKK